MRTPCGPRNSPPHLAVLWEGRLGYRMPSKDSDRAYNLLNIKWLQQSLSSPGLYDRRLKVRQWMLNSIPRLAPRIVVVFFSAHTMIEVKNHIKVLLKSTGRSEYFLFQDDECVTAIIVYLLMKSWAGFTLQINLTKHQQRRGLMPVYFKATIMSLTLRYQSIDHLQADWRPTLGMAHHNFLMLRLLSVSIGLNHRNNKKNC